MKESAVLAQCRYILNILQRQGRLLYRRIHTTGVPRNVGGKIVLTKNEDMKGMSDIQIFLPNGKTLHPEMKRPKGKRSPEQTVWAENLQRFGHSCQVIESVDDLLKMLNAEGVNVSDWMPRKTATGEEE